MSELFLFVFICFYLFLFVYQKLQKTKENYKKPR